MKKARATKILCAVLTVIMVLGTGLSAMAAVTGTSVVKYNVDKTAYGVTTEVSGLAENEMVTYLVHNASSMYNVAPSNIDFIDQKNANGTTAQFGYKGTGDWETKANKIYIGAESLAAPVESGVTLTEEGVAVTVNGALIKGAAIDGKDAAGIKKIALDCVPYIVDVAYNGTSVDFFRVGDAIAFYTDAALDKEADFIAITTLGVSFTDDPTADGVLSAADIIAMGKAIDPTTQTAIVHDNGSISGWMGLLSNIRGNSTNDGQGETGAAGFWYQNGYTLAESGYDVSAVTVNFNEACLPVGVRTDPNTGNLVGGNEWPESVKEQVLADYNAGETSTTIDASDFKANGVTLNNKSGAEIELSFNVPVAGDYKLIGRSSVWEASRKAQLAIDGKSTLALTNVATQKMALGTSDSVYLEAGDYTAKLNANVSGPTRLDFIALVPATAAVNAAYDAALASEAADDDAAVAFKEFLALGEFSKGEAGIKLGTVKAEGSSFVAFGRVKGEYTECGIEIYFYNEDEIVSFPALGVSGTPGISNGGFAIELIDEDGADLAAELSGAEVQAYYITTDGSTEYSSPVVTLE